MEIVSQKYYMDALVSSEPKVTKIRTFSAPMSNFRTFQDLRKPCTKEFFGTAVTSRMPFLSSNQQ